CAKDQQWPVRWGGVVTTFDDAFDFW
nr:immunoglobulin heavy chain junction region [Macaca mulatta]